jgi:hypothetical protein
MVFNASRLTSDIHLLLSQDSGTGGVGIEVVHKNVAYLRCVNTVISEQCSLYAFLSSAPRRLSSQASATCTFAVTGVIWLALSCPNDQNQNRYLR